MRLRVYLIGYDPKGLDLEALGEEWITDQISKCDLCIDSRGRPAPKNGDTITLDVGVAEDHKGFYVVTETEHHGKVLVLKQVQGRMP